MKSRNSGNNQRWRWAAAAAVAVYCVLGLLLLLQNPGLQYDEALQILGAVHMLNSPEELNLAHDPDTWVCPFNRCIPLMTVRYVGALKEYLCLPMFALFGTPAEVLRLASLLLGALGIAGIASLLGAHVGWPVAAATALVLAVHPAYVDLTVFDNGAVAIWMGTLGLLCLSVSRYLRLRTWQAAFWVGVAIGLGVWSRANFAWLVAALLVAALLTLGRHLLLPMSHYAAWVGGGLAGGLPFFLYQIQSKGGTWEALSMFRAEGSLADRLTTRAVMLAETLLSDREHRAIWDGPPLPDWQAWLFPAAVLTACLVCLFCLGPAPGLRRPWGRLLVLALLLLGGVMFFSRLPVSEHHLIALVPLAAAVTVLAGAQIARTSRFGLAAVVALASVYLGSALYWQVAAIRGLHATGGTGQWSDAVFALSDHLQREYPEEEIKILDWGLQYNLYYLSGGKLRSREIYAAEQPDSGSQAAALAEHIRDGGVFLLNGPENSHFPAASGTFLKLLAEMRPTYRRNVVRQRSGLVYAEIIQVDGMSGTAEPSTVGAPAATSSVSMADPLAAPQLAGFHQVEEAAWRWSKRRFAITLGVPERLRQEGGRLQLRVFLPDASFERLGPVRLSASVNGHALEPESLNGSGQRTLSFDLPAGVLRRGGNRFEFTLDKALPPNARDGRELGVIVHGASLEAR